MSIYTQLGKQGRSRELRLLVGLQAGEITAEQMEAKLKQLAVICPFCEGALTPSYYCAKCEQYIMDDALKNKTFDDRK